MAKYRPLHSTGRVARREYPAFTIPAIHAQKLGYGTLAAVTLGASLAVPVTAFANPLDDDTTAITTTTLPTFEITGEWTDPPTEGDDQAKYDAWVEAGMPGYVGETGSSKGVEADSADPQTVPNSPEVPPANPGHNWDAVALCESSGDWAANTGNSYYGGLQIWEPTWHDFGGDEFAPLPHLATKEQQIIVAERILAEQGIGAWPTCGEFLGQSADPAPSQAAPNASVAQTAVNFARAQIGDAYVWGATGPDAWDCSSLTQASMRAAGINITRTTYTQSDEGWNVPFETLTIGDLVYIDGYNHVAIVSGWDANGNTMIIEAQQPGVGVVESQLSIYAGRIDEVRRYV